MTDWLTNSKASASRAEQHLGAFAASSRVASHQIAKIIGIARRNRPADDRNAEPGSSWIWIASPLGVTLDGLIDAIVGWWTLLLSMGSGSPSLEWVKGAGGSPGRIRGWSGGPANDTRRYGPIA
jgi:hypothetical protein